MIACGMAEGGGSTSFPFTPFADHLQQLVAPEAFGTDDVDLITGAETGTNITQSETFTAANPDNPNQIVVAYNDSRGRNKNPINISGASYSATAATASPASPLPTVKALSKIPWATPLFSITARPAPGSLSGLT